MGGVFGLFATQERQEVQKVFGIKRGGGRGQPGRQIGKAGYGHPMFDNGLARLRQGAIAAAFGGHINNNGPRRHGLDHGFIDQFGGGPPGDQRRGNHNVLFGDMLGDQLGLFLLILGRHLLGITAGGFGGLELFIFDGDKFCPQRGHLFLGRGAHIGGGDNGPQAPCRGNGLQAGNPGPHDKGFGRCHGARRGHHHRQGLAIKGGGLNHGAITGQIGLGRERIHGLSARNARNEFHGIKINALGGTGAYKGGVIKGVQETSNPCPFFQARQDICTRATHTEQHICPFQGRRRGFGDAGPGLFILGVCNARPGSGSGFYGHAVTGGDKLFDGFRRGCHAGLACNSFLENGQLHNAHLYANDESELASIRPVRKVFF